MDLKDIKDKIYSRVKETSPVRAAMFLKNWKRYETCVLFILSNGLDKNKTILDYGCGHPFVSKILIDLGYNVTPYEPYAGEEELKIADLLGIKNIYKTLLPEGQQFDFVLMIDVIEHLSIIKPIMQDVHNKTKANGCLFISTPNVMRIEMWAAFLLRQTGHPQPLITYLNCDDNYTNHQREFTLAELNNTLIHFGFSIKKSTCKSTQPTSAELSEYHRLSGKKVSPLPLKRKMLNGFFGVLKSLFPTRLTNNLLVIGQKK